MITTPYGFQFHAARFAHRHKYRCLLAMEAGLGKSLCSLMCLERHPEIGPMVVVCPAVAKYNWEAEALKHFGWRAEVLSGMTAPRHKNHGNRPVTVVNYDILGPWANWIREGGVGTVVLDECQLLQSRGTARLRAVRNLTRGVPRVMALSGTPLVNRPSELWPTLNIIRPDLYPDFRNYANLFCAPRRTHFGWSYDGASNLGLLHDQLSEFMLRMRKADVLHELPNKRTTVVPLPVTDMREYDRAEKTFLSWLAQNRPDKVMGALRAQRLVQIGYLKRLAAQLKLPSALAWIDSFLQNSDEKLIVFACHYDIIDAVRERYGKLCVHIDGRVSTRSRQAVVTAFQHDKRVRLFVGNIRAAGTAITLTAASTVAFIELDWTPGAHSQAGDRAHRLTQEKECEMVWLIAHGTIEETIAAVIQRKQGVLDAVLDGGTPEDGGMDIHDELMEALGVP